MTRLYIYRDHQLRVARAGETEESLRAGGYFARHPDAIVCRGGKPGPATLERWADDGVACALDGCRVEPDGTCQHGAPSWLIALGVI